MPPPHPNPETTGVRSWGGGEAGCWAGLPYTLERREAVGLQRGESQVPGQWALLTGRGREQLGIFSYRVLTDAQ